MDRHMDELQADIAAYEGTLAQLEEDAEEEEDEEEEEVGEGAVCDGAAETAVQWEESHGASVALQRRAVQLELRAVEEERRALEREEER